MNPATPRDIELLAPARDTETAIQAILHGADAVYIGASSHGARQSAANSVDDIARLCDFSHRFGARVYVTVNTIIYDSELAEVEQLVWDLWRAGADALIVQDMALLRMHLPPIPLHASTQCDTRTPAKARFLQDAGFSQVVLARELSLDEIRGVAAEVSVPLEVFVHGALCVCYSGDCQASLMVTGRSANRGECAQICRFPFDLTDSKGNVYERGRHLLSLRDMNRLALLSDLLAAGASSLKIEGRLKDSAYVRNVTAAYRAALDRIIDANPGLYRRASRGRSEVSFIPDLNKSFNRGYTSYFLKGTPREAAPMAQFGTPKWIGEPVGEVVRNTPRMFEARLSAPLNNGDGLGFFGPDGRFEGFRVNRVEGNRLFTASPVNVAPGTKLYRNSDSRRNAQMQSTTAVRTIGVDMTLRRTSWGVALDVAAEGLPAVTATVAAEFQAARTPQAEARRRVLTKTGDTIYRVSHIDDRAADCFIPASVLTALRRDALGLLDLQSALSAGRDRRRAAVNDLKLPQGAALSRHDNVANRMAEDFYRAAGADAVPRALETDRADSSASEVRVMECRYCLRREMGACLRTPQGSRLPRDLFLTSGPNRFRLEFDCARCQMRLWYQTR